VHGRESNSQFVDRESDGRKHYTTTPPYSTTFGQHALPELVKVMFGPQQTEWRPLTRFFFTDWINE